MGNHSLDSPGLNPARIIYLLAFVVIVVVLVLSLILPTAKAFGPIPKPDQCISVNALLNRNCAPVYMCNGPKGTNADWCCSMERRWLTEEQNLLRWYKRNCRTDG